MFTTATNEGFRPLVKLRWQGEPCLFGFGCTVKWRQTFIFKKIHNLLLVLLRGPLNNVHISHMINFYIIRADRIERTLSLQRFLSIQQLHYSLCFSSIGGLFGSDLTGTGNMVTRGLNTNWLFKVLVYDSYQEMLSTKWYQQYAD